MNVPEVERPREFVEGGAETDVPETVRLRRHRRHDPERKNNRGAKPSRKSVSRDS
jgi:hypothetical protein